MNANKFSINYLTAGILTPAGPISNAVLRNETGNITDGQQLSLEDVEPSEGSQDSIQDCNEGNEIDQLDAKHTDSTEYW